MSDQGKTYLAFIEDEYQAEQNRRIQADTRGASLVTTSTSLVTLLAGIVTFFRVGDDSTFPRSGLPWLVLAMIMLGAAAAAGIVASWNRAYKVAHDATLERFLNEHWVDHEVDARNHAGMLRFQSIASLRRLNAWKAAWITLGLIAQLLALTTLGVVVYIMLPTVA